MPLPSTTTERFLIPNNEAVRLHFDNYAIDRLQFEVTDKSVS